MRRAEARADEDVVKDGLVVRVAVEGRRGEGHKARHHFWVVLEEADPPGLVRRRAWVEGVRQCSSSGSGRVGEGVRVASGWPWKRESRQAWSGLGPERELVRGSGLGFEALWLDHLVQH